MVACLVRFTNSPTGRLGRSCHRSWRRRRRWFAVAPRPRNPWCDAWPSSRRSRYGCYRRRRANDEDQSGDECHQPIALAEGLLVGLGRRLRRPSLG